jgi:hypothetical protein
MMRYDLDGGIPTLAVALAEHINLDELKVLATLTKTRAPARKAELVEHILTFLEGDRLRTASCAKIRPKATRPRDSRT